MLKSKIKTPLGDAVFLTLACIFLAPIGLNVFNVGGKPIDVVFSDIVVILGVFAYFTHIFFYKFGKLEGQILFTTLFAIIFFLMLAAVGCLETGTLNPVLSAFKYVKPLLAIMLGLYVAKYITLCELWRLLTLASLFTLVGLIVGQALVKGSIIGRWGEYFFYFENYGFPNSAAQYYVLLEMFLISGIIFYKHKALYIASSVVLAAFIVLSLSRSGAVVVVIFIVMFFLMTLNTRQKISSIVVVLMLIPALALVSIKNKESFVVLKEGLGARIDRTVSSDDPLSGRFNIAKKGMGLVSEKPILGYKFDSFSNYNERHGTLHNQYIESLFKTGMIGTVIYFGLMFWLIYLAYKRLGSSYIGRNDKECIKLMLFALFCLFIGNLTQPNFTYSQTGNLVFFLLGFVALYRDKSLCKRA